MWSWSYGSWIYNYLCNQCLSPLMLWVCILLIWGVLDTTLCDKVCQWLAGGLWFSPVSSTKKTDCHYISEILLRVALNTITLNPLKIGVMWLSAFDIYALRISLILRCFLIKFFWLFTVKMTNAIVNYYTWFFFP